jgi:hypothetical protein
MTKFAELHARFVAWDTALTQYEQKATMVMLGYYSGFCQYLGFDPTSGGDVITLHKIDPTATGLSKHVAVDHFSKALSQDDDGTWRFGLTVKMREGVLFDQVVNPDKGKEIVIKVPHTSEFYFDMRFTLRDDECNFQNAQDQTKSFPYKFIEQTLYGPPDAYIYLAGILETVFSAKPGYPPVHQPLGFDYLVSPRR